MTDVHVYACAYTFVTSHLQNIDSALRPDVFFYVNSPLRIFCDVTTFLFTPQTIKVDCNAKILSSYYGDD